MKKIYLAFILGAYTFTSYAQQSEELVSSLTIYDLTKEKMNNTYSDSQTNTIKIKTNEPTIGNGKFTYFSDIENPLECAGETTEGLEDPTNSMYTRFILKGAGNTKPNRSPYFILDFDTPTTGIKEIQLMGKAAGSNEKGYEELLYAFSTVSNPSLNDFEFLPDEYKPLKFIVGQCNYDNLRIKLPEGTVSVIFISTDNFGGWYVDPAHSYPAEFHAIRFFSKKNNPTGVNGDTVEQYYSWQKGSTIFFNQKSNVHIYNMSGQLIEKGSDCTSLNIDNQNKGVYIIKAVSTDTGKSIARKINIQ